MTAELHAMQDATGLPANAEAEQALQDAIDQLSKYRDGRVPERRF